MKYIGSRDMQASSAVAVMAQLGRFETEYLIYGSAVQEKDNKIYYYATTNQEKLYQCMESAWLEERYFMPMIQHIKRVQVPADLEFEWLMKTKLELICLMKSQYESYISLMQPLLNRTPNDQAVQVLLDYQDAIDGYFDDTMLQLFEGLIIMSYKGKILSKDNFIKFKNWHDKVRHQMADDPVCIDNVTRELFGFVFVDNKGQRQVFFDAQKMNVVEMQHKKMVEGFLVAPIIKKQYAFKQFSEMPKVRAECAQWLLLAQSEAYFQCIKKLKKMPGVISEKEVKDISKAIDDHKYARMAMDYYSAILNMSK